MCIYSNVQNESIKTMFPIVKKCILNQIPHHLVTFLWIPYKTFMCFCMQSEIETFETSCIMFLKSYFENELQALCICT